MNTNITLVILAAGFGTRYKDGLKQFALINNKTIMNYTIDDAIKIGFNKIVFVIRKET